MARLSHRWADRVIVNSRAALEEELAAGVPERLLVHVGNGIEVPTVTPEVGDRAAITGTGPLAVAVAQLAPEKDHATLLRAWRMVLEGLPDARLALVGEGPLRGKLEAQCRELGIDARVSLVGFDQPGPWITAADLVVLSSRTEGLPNALLEAMAHGKAVVATRVGGVPELVVDGETGVLVDAADHVALSAAIVRLLTRPGLRTMMGEAGRSRARDRFSTERLVAETEAVYASVAARGRGGVSASTRAPTRTGPSVAP